MNPSPPFLPSPSRRTLLAASGASLLLGAAGCATRPATPAVGADVALAPTGRLRASINLGNPVLARRDATTGVVAGVSIDLARALADEIAVPLELIIVDGAAQPAAPSRSDAPLAARRARRVGEFRKGGVRFIAAWQ